MKHNYRFLFCLLFSLNSYFVLAQDRIYTKDNRVLEGKIFAINTEDSEFRYQRNDFDENQPSFAVKQEDVMMVFDRNGRFIIFPDSYTTTKELEIFILPVEKSILNYRKDKIVTFDRNVIEGDIISETKDKIVYESNGQKRELLETNIAVVIYKNGEHKIHIYNTIAAKILEGVKNTVNEINKKIGYNIEKKQIPIEESNNENINFREFEQKALSKVDLLKGYIKLILSKKTELSKADEAVNSGCRLFIDENVDVEVSNIKTKDIKINKIRKYLENLKLLNYDRVEINWTKINYVSQFRKGSDGKYYGTITFQQEFKGYRDKKLIYKDFIEKSMEVIVQTYIESKDGKDKVIWEIFLGNIKVEQHK